MTTDCPVCGSKMTEEIHRIKSLHRFGKKRNTLRNKTQRRYTYNCRNCKKQFVLSKLLVECEIVD